MKKLIIGTLLVSSSLLASDISINSIGVNLGVSSTDYSQTNNQGTIILGNEPDKSFNSYELYTLLNPISDISKEYDMKPYISRV